ncbi:glyoxalase/bleomycin resistance/extradiol dioxygenase family protein [Martelella alba]|uniref:Glyoxalase/bleomycin resistance/extradiol dioxygenase family protein n=1 Tax=Martelella alba TaxID=2590451 RepID=A0A506U5T3_9HYPH|nr:VOC family protein [Martelella alba]TPW28471.1 glyoxalase/bleomycin resistance/extradiol dioxygenase family protein [Martelella alba]
MTTIAHVAMWTGDLERMAAFYRDHFGAAIGPRYESRRRPGFVSRFITLSQGPAIEIMQLPQLGPPIADAERPGYAHLAIALGSADAVNRMARRAEMDGFLKSPPRLTGDGFYEAVIADPDGNPIEITP